MLIHQPLRLHVVLLLDGLQVPVHLLDDLLRVLLRLLQLRVGLLLPLQLEDQHLQVGYLLLARGPVAALGRARLGRRDAKSVTTTSTTRQRRA